MIARARLRLLRRALVLLLALWLPAGPLASSAAATLEASHAGCRSGAGKLGCHGAKSGKVGCHGPARRIGCHDSASAKAETSATKQTKSEKRSKCGCSDLAISATRCGCRHGSPAAAVSIERTLPKPTFGLSLSPDHRDAAPRFVALALIAPADPPDPPPRVSSSPRPH